MIIRVSDIPQEGLTVDDAAAAGSPFADPGWRLEGLNLTFERDAHDVLVQG